MRDTIIKFLHGQLKEQQQLYQTTALFLSGLTGEPPERYMHPDNQNTQTMQPTTTCASVLNKRDKYTSSDGLLRLTYSADDPGAQEAYIEYLHKQDVVNSGTNKEVNEEVPHLKYGQGSICKVERKNKDGTVYKYWQARYMCAGKQKTITAKTADECLKRLQAAKKNSPVVPRKTTPKVGCLAYWVEEWFNKYRKPRIKASTAKTYTHVIDVLKTSDIGKTALREVHTEQLQEFLMSISQPNTREKFYDVINSAFKKAVALDYVRKNPAELVEIPTAKSKPRRAYTFDEQNKMLATLNPRYSAVFRFLCCTGMRIGEFVALTESSIDTQRHLIWVTESISANEGERTTPKTDSSVRAIPYLEELFEGINLGTYTYDGIKKAFKVALAKSGITGVFIHNTRHTFSSLCYYHRVPDKFIQAWMGHSTVAMTMDTYTHIMDNGTSPIGDYVARLRNSFTHTHA